MKQKQITYHDQTAVNEEEILFTPSEASCTESVAVLLWFHTPRWTTNKVTLRKNEAVSHAYHPIEPGRTICTGIKPNYRTTKIG